MKGQRGPFLSAVGSFSALRMSLMYFKHSKTQLNWDYTVSLSKWHWAKNGPRRQLSCPSNFPFSNSLDRKRTNGSEEVKLLPGFVISQCPGRNYNLIAAQRGIWITCSHWDID